MTPTAVLFDLDGTLVDSLADLTASVNALLFEFGRPELTQTQVAHAIGHGARNLVRRTCSMRGVTLEGQAFEEAYGRFRAIYLDRCCDATRPLPGALEIVRDLAERGIPCGVVTNKPQAATDRLLAHLGFAPWIGAALGGDTPFGRKPSAEPVIEVARRLGAAVPSERVWLVGDSKTDLDAAAAAGITAIGVRGGYDQGESLDALAASALRILDRIEEIRELVEE